MTDFSPDSISRWRTQSDEQFLTDCRLDAFRGSGPGGQKRNKTSSAVRLTHVPTGLFATASESRSQHDNQRHALKRLRHRLAVELRRPVELSDEDLANTGPQLKTSPRSEIYLRIVGLVVDVLDLCAWSISAAAAKLGTSTGQLIAFLSRDEPLWSFVNQQRGAQGLRMLNARK